MNKEYLRTLSQIVQNQPLSLVEVKEIVLRHLINNSDNEMLQHVSECLIMTYLALARSNAIETNKLVEVFKNPGYHEWPIETFFKDEFAKGYRYGQEESNKKQTEPPDYWPPILSFTLEEYPTEIIKQFAAVLGYQMAFNEIN